MIIRIKLYVFLFTKNFLRIGHKYTKQKFSDAQSLLRGPASGPLYLLKWSTNFNKNILWIAEHLVYLNVRLKSIFVQKHNFILSGRMDKHPVEKISVQ